ALKNYLAVRPENLSDILFLNYKGEPISERGIRKLVVKYRKNAGITKRASCTLSGIPSPPIRRKKASLPSSSNSGWDMQTLIRHKSMSIWENRTLKRLWS